jgi:prepilin-type N-terminal cleavage/methylation domain-containing protein/prepilin-type processing-associated H-X9-DG protein
MRFRRNTHCAFTIIELLVVVGVIGILAGMLLPALAKARSSSRSVACINNERQWGMCFDMYSQDHDGYLLDLRHWQSVHWKDSIGNITTNPYASYLGGGKPGPRLHLMRLCPTVAASMSAKDIHYARVYNYSMSLPNVLINGAYQPLPAAVDGSLSFGLKSVPKPAEFLLMIDTDGSVADSSRYIVTQGTLASRVAGIQDRHSHGMNALFADYHAEWISYSKIVQQAATPAAQNTWFLAN